MATGMFGNSLLFRCLSCPKTFYSFDHGHAIISNATTKQKHNIACLPCPYGGKCSNKIKAKPNFWGYKSEDLTVKFLSCPIEYCCQGKGCISYSCNKNREGVLCGRCRKGFVQELTSSKCIEKRLCGSALIWLVVILGGLSYVIFLMYLPEISNFIKTIVYWKKGNNPNGSNTVADKNYALAALIKVIFFFSQMEPLLKIEQNTGASLKHSKRFIQMAYQFKSILTAALNFQISISCPFKTLTAVTKTAVHACFPVVALLVLASLLITLCMVKFVKKAVHRVTENNVWQRESMITVRLVSCLVNLVLLTYGTVAKATLSLLNCVTVNQHWVLYLDGNIACYTFWQISIAAFACIFVFPLPIGLALSVRRFKNKKLTVKQFLLRLGLPIILIFDILGSFIHQRGNPDQEQDANLSINAEMGSGQGSMELNSSAQASVLCNRSQGNFNDSSLCLEESDQLSEESLSSWEPSCHNDHPGPNLQEPLLSQSMEGLQQNLSEMQSQNSSEKAVLTLIDSPFSISQGKYHINWESVLIARRLIFAAVFTFTPYPTLRITIMLVMCLVMILHTSYASPYASNAVNKCEIVLLVILIIMCLVNCLVSFSHESNTHLTGYLKLLPNISLWVKAILVDVFPVIIFFAVIVWIAVRLFFFCVTIYVIKFDVSF